MTEAGLRIVVVGHTNAGKTSLLRTLTRRVDFGQVSDQPGTTRHSETTSLRLEDVTPVVFVDTPGLEDSVALLEFLRRQPGATGPQRVRAFLQGPEASAAFEQEAKVLRALLDQADAAILVVDARAPVLPKYQAELELLSWCARPIMPVLNFVRDAGARLTQWHEALRAHGLHARAEFDVVAPLHGSERQLYQDLAALLPEQRQRIVAIADALERERKLRRVAACRIIADTLVDVAAMRDLVADAGHGAQHQAQAVDAFRGRVREHAQRAAGELRRLYAFGARDLQEVTLPELPARWADDLFNPELLKSVATRMGWGAILGAGAGAVVDVALAGLSLGAATAIGAGVGGTLSGGWQPLWRKLENRLKGVRELTAQDAVLVLLAAALSRLAQELGQRGHGARAPQALDMEALAGSEAPQRFQAIVQRLQPARGHAEWERGRRGFRDEPGRAVLAGQVADALVQLQPPDPGGNAIADSSRVY